MVWVNAFERELQEPAGMRVAARVHLDALAGALRDVDPITVLHPAF